VSATDAADQILGSPEQADGKLTRALVTSKGHGNCESHVPSASDRKGLEDRTMVNIPNTQTHAPSLMGSPWVKLRKIATPLLVLLLADVRFVLSSRAAIGRPGGDAARGLLD
jgi:hypothetical protein